MSFLDQITVLILTYNEAPNIGRTLMALQAFPRVVVLDSGSDDGTIQIVESFPNTAFYVRNFDTHATQWNFGLEGCGISTKWVLALDADYFVPAALIDEISRLDPQCDVSSYRAFFDYWVLGKPLSGTLYPPLKVLFRLEHARYVQAGHTQRLLIAGGTSDLKNRIAHDDRKPLSRWLTSQQEYAKLEADFLLATPKSELRLSGWIRRLGWPGPILIFLYTLFAKRCLFDGWAGWFYVVQRTLTEGMIAAEIVDRRLRANLRTSEISGRGEDAILCEADCTSNLSERIKL